MKGSSSKNGDKNDSRSKSKIDGVSNFSESMKKNKNFQRMGGRGLSLAAFANAKTKTGGYNPAVIKKKREFYKNAKYVSKYKKQVKHLTHQNDLPLSLEPIENENEFEDHAKSNHYRKYDKRKKGSQNLEDIYATKRKEQEKLHSEREAAIKAKREERERSEARRKELREKMFKKTRKGQPVMKYRIEHLLETIQRSAN